MFRVCRCLVPFLCSRCVRCSLTPALVSMHVGQRRWRAVVWTLHALFLEGCAAHLLLRAMVAPRGVQPAALATMPEPSGAADSAVEACRPIQNLPLLPVRAAAALMPGERRTYPIKDGRMRNFFLAESKNPQPPSRQRTSRQRSEAVAMALLLYDGTTRPRSSHIDTNSQQGHLRQPASHS